MIFPNIRTEWISTCFFKKLKLRVKDRAVSSIFQNIADNKLHIKVIILCGAPVSGVCLGVNQNLQGHVFM